MRKTIDVLFDAVQKTDECLSHGVLNDYFGIINFNCPENMQLIFGIYTGMIKVKGVKKELFENCFFTNRLDELIHTKAKYHKSGYYQLFCTKNIKIGNTYIGDSGVEAMPIMDDDCCPCCEATGYVTENKNLSGMTPDCESCGLYMCKDCVIMEDEHSGICKNCKK